MTKHRPSVEHRALTVSANEGTPAMDQTTGRYRYVYNVTVRSDATGASVRFTYHDSIANYDEGKRGLAGDDLLYAFWSFVSDASAGSQPFDDFCADFGYDADSRTARATWRACLSAARRLGTLYHEPTDPADVLEQLESRGIA